MEKKKKGDDMNTIKERKDVRKKKLLDSFEKAVKANGPALKKLSKN